jgi:hypothetical protein
VHVSLLANASLVGRYSLTGLWFRQSIIRDGIAENGIDGTGEALPGAGAAKQFAPACLGEDIDFTRRASLGVLPAALNPALSLQRAECRVQRAFSHLQGIVTAPLNLSGNRIAVAWAFRENCQKQGWGISFEEFPHIIGAFSGHGSLFPGFR